MIAEETISVEVTAGKVVRAARVVAVEAVNLTAVVAVQVDKRANDCLDK
jgi:hypothetical protein